MIEYFKSKLPFIDIFCAVVKAHIAFMPTLGYCALSYRLAYGAALFARMRAGGEPALSEIRREFPEAVEQLVLQNSFCFIKLKGRKARSVRNIAAGNPIKLAMARCVPAAAELFAGFPRFQLKRRIDSV